MYFDIITAGERYLIFFHRCVDSKSRTLAVSL